MAILFKNNAASTLTYKMTNAQEVLYVADASVFPVIADGSGDVFKLTLVGEDTLEIVEAYAAYNPKGRQGFRIRRAQEGTTAQAWPAGTRVELRITADALNSFVPTAVQIAKDYVDATGVASTTNVGFAGVDGKTTKADAEGVITAKDVAIGGNLADLATARGQLGNYKTVFATGDDLNDVITSGTYAVSPGCANVPMNGTSDYYVLEVLRGESNVNAVTQFIYSRVNTAGPTWSRRRISNGTWQPWQQLVQTNYIGDGIKISRSKALADGTGGLCIISVPEYEGATALTAGTSGLVPPAAAGEQESFLTGGGEYKPALSTKGGVLTGSVQINDTANVISTAPAKNAERGIFIADKNGAIMGGFDNVQRASDNVKWTQMFAKTNNGNITSLAAVAHEDGTGEIVTYHPIQISGVQLNQTIDGKNRVFILSGDRTNQGYTFRFSPDTGEVYMDGRAIHAKADTAGYADTAGSAPANGGRAWEANRLLRADGGATVWNWHGQGGQPQWLWGSNDGESMYVYNPSNFSVSYANSANYATTAGSADNASTAWQTTIVPNVTYVGRGGSMPAGGSWLYIYMPYDRHFLRSAILAGGAGAPDNNGGIAIKVG
jgi:hypothetical protein